VANSKEFKEFTKFRPLLFVPYETIFLFDLLLYLFDTVHAHSVTH
jgi:hypothetical protein